MNVGMKSIGEEQSGGGVCEGNPTAPSCGELGGRNVGNTDPKSPKGDFLKLRHSVRSYINILHCLIYIACRQAIMFRGLNNLISAFLQVL